MGWVSSGDVYFWNYLLQIRLQKLIMTTKHSNKADNWRASVLMHNYIQQNNSFAFTWDLQILPRTRSIHYCLSHGFGISEKSAIFISFSGWVWSIGTIASVHVELWTPGGFVCGWGLLIGRLSPFPWVHLRSPHLGAQWGTGWFYKGNVLKS